MLSQLHPESTYTKLLLSTKQWYPYPNRQDRNAWNTLPIKLQQTLIKQGDASLNFAWPSLPATAFLQFVRNGNRSQFEQLSFERRSHLLKLVLAECVEANGRFLDAIVNGIWAICEESFWGLPAHLFLQQAGRGLPDTAEPTVDLFVAETFNLLAWTYYLMGTALDEVSPLVRPRIVREIDKRGLTPLEQREDFDWMGFTASHSAPRRVNNWNPWIVSNWLATLLIIEQDPQRRGRCFYKALKTLDHFIDPYPADGGCDEGPGYWGRAGASLFDCLELIFSATDGNINVYDNTKIQNIGRYIYRAQIAGDYFLNFADASAIVSHSPALIHRFGQRLNDSAMMALGAWFSVHSSAPSNHLRDTIGRILPALFTHKDLQATEPIQPLPRDVWMNNIQVMIARDQEGSSAGFYVAVKGGNNEESHNHNDIGNFVVYMDGKPVIVDAGVETYTQKTFGPNRYDIWTMVSSYHTLLPTIDGAEQLTGAAYKATHVSYTCNDRWATMKLDMANAYDSSVGITSWARQVTLNRGYNIEITDTYHMSKNPTEITVSLLTPCTVNMMEPGTLDLTKRMLGDKRQSGQATIKYPPQHKVLIEPIQITDTDMSTVWGQQLIRLVFIASQPSTAATWTYYITC